MYKVEIELRENGTTHFSWNKDNAAAEGFR